MKKALSLAVSMLLMLSVLLTACNQPVVITLTSAKSSAKRGETVQLTSSLEGVSYELTEGDDNASVDENGLVTVNSDAEIGAVLKIVAKKDLIVSNEVEIEIVHTPITSLSNAKAVIGTETVTVVAPNDEVTLSVIVAPANATEAVTWSIANGYDKATITGNKLKVSATAVNNDQIILIANGGTSVSNTILLTVNITIPLTKVELSASLTTVKPGQSTTLQLEFTPSNATDKAVEWVFSGLSGVPYPNAEGVLTIPADILPEGTTEATLTVVAKVGTKQSEPLVITVKVPDTSLFINIVNNPDIINEALRVRNRETHPVFLEVSVTDNQTGRPVVEEVEFKVTDEHGVEIQENAKKIKLIPASSTTRQVQVLKHGNDNYITISLKNGGADPEIIQVNAIKAPSMIDMPKFLDYVNTDGDLDAYSIGVTGENGNTSIDFSAIVPTNDGACPDVSYTFEMVGDDSLASDDIATVVDSKLTFKEQGLVKMTIESLAGDAIQPEPLIQFFEVNNGKNIGNWEDLKAYMEDGARVDGFVVNFVITSHTMNVSGQDLYDMIPNFVVDNYNTDTLNAVKALYSDRLGLPGEAHIDNYIAEHVRIRVYDKGAIVNGNNHAVNFDKLKPFNRPANTTGGVYSIRAFSFIPSPSNVTTSLYAPTGTDEWAERVHSEVAYELAILSPQEKQELVEFDNDYDNKLLINLGVLQEDLSTRPQSDFPIFRVGLNNLKLLGSLLPTGTSTADGTGAIGKTHNHAIEIGAQRSYYHYVVKSKNLEIRNFESGMQLNRLLSVDDSDTTNDSYFEGTQIVDIYAKGIEQLMSITEFNNLYIGFCGALGIELAQNYSNRAGLNQDEKNTIKLSGDYHPGEPNNFETKYFQDYVIVAGTSPKGVKDIFNLTILNRYNAETLSYINHPGSYTNYYLMGALTFSDLPNIERVLLISLINFLKDTTLERADRYTTAITIFGYADAGNLMAIATDPVFGSYFTDLLVDKIINVSEIIYTDGELVSLDDLKTSPQTTITDATKYVNVPLILTPNDVRDLLPDAVPILLILADYGYKGFPLGNIYASFVPPSAS